jgi:hypothetical protein
MVCSAAERNMLLRLRSPAQPTQPHLSRSSFDKKEIAMTDTFPAVGHRYLVDFQQFRVELFFESKTSMTYRGVRADGTRGDPETVTIKIEPIRDQLFLVTWQEADNTTVVHLEDYKENTIVTNITEPPNMKFEQFHGTMTLIS